jgi:SAM-dependent methyltransferase
MAPFNEFVLSQLPQPPGRVLEVGCGREGGIAPDLAGAGYEVLAIDPWAPEGPLYRQVTLAELDDPGPFAAVVASRVLHHLHPLGPALEKLAGLAPLLLVDEFAWERIDGPTRQWYEGQHRALAAAGQEPPGPRDLGRWLKEHDDLHPSGVLLWELRKRYEETCYEERPYLYRWLCGVATEGLEESLITADVIRPIGLRWTGGVRYP